MGNDNIKRIEIDLSNIRAKKYHDENNSENHILLNVYYEKIVDLISDRIEEIDKYRQMNFDIDNINEVKMHDAILIYGSRGNGKSTVMINLQDFITGKHFEKVKNAKKLEKKVKIFETIDPTIQEEDEDFLLVVLSAILREVENHQEHKFTKRDAFYESLENVLKIVEATRSKKKDDIDIFDKFYGLKSGVGLAEELHKLFKHTKEIFDVEILVIPIDDVDMNLKQGYQIADSIRKYMSSPYIIPIVAFNIRQMRVVTKFNKYKQFGLRIDQELEMEELSFLRSLPNDYLSKIFPPNRRIYLKSVFEILDEANEKIIFKKDDSIALEAFDMISLVSELFYESHYDLRSFEDSTFLSTRSMRNYLNDCYCVLSSLNKEDDQRYTITRKIIKDRLAPDDIPPFVTKEHALTWLWNRYIEVAKKNLKSQNNILKNYNWAKMITETLPEDNSAEVINKKTYARVWLQEYYRTQESIRKINLNNQREYILEKRCNIAGALELAMRSYIPMYLFEHIVKNRNLEYSNSDLIYLKSFSSRSLQGVAYELSMMEATLKKEEQDYFDPKVIGAISVDEVLIEHNNNIAKKEFNIPFLFKIANKDKLTVNANQLYILSIFKAMALFIELSKIYQSKNQDKEIMVKSLLETYRVNLPMIDDAVKMKDNYFDEYIKEKKASPCKEGFMQVLEIDFTNSSFGVLEIAAFSKRLVDFFMNVRDNISDNKVNFTMPDNNEQQVEFYMPLITYFTSFAQSLFLSLFNSIRYKNILAIKTINECDDKIIFRKNSLYGTKKNEGKTDHLYQENICNLKEVVENNRSHENFKEIQQSFYNLFNYINNDIPFFKLLIDKANFLTKLQDNQQSE